MGQISNASVRHTEASRTRLGASVDVTDARKACALNLDRTETSDVQLGACIWRQLD